MTGSPVTLATEFIILILLIIASAFISGSELAYFSLTPNDIEELHRHKGRNHTQALRLLAKPDRLLSTILVANNFINIAIIILAAFISTRLFDLRNNPILAFIIEVIVISFIIMLFCEILPREFASRRQLKFALMMAPALTFTSGLFRPIASLLTRSAFLLRGKHKLRDGTISMKELSVALDLTTEEIRDDKELLRGVVRFGNTTVSEIMCPRIDVTALDSNRGFHDIMNEVIDAGFSRVPVFSKTFDNITGILFVKDLLPHLAKPDNFRWQTLIRQPYVIPETKKISELLKEFQTKKIHMAIVVDEYGGTSGLVTLEDVLEEIVGDITDETDEEEPLFRVVADAKWVFDGKITLNDFCRITRLEENPFDDVRGDSETLAGLLLELLGEIPVEGRVISAGGFRFTIESIEERRIKEITAERKIESS